MGNPTDKYPGNTVVVPFERYEEDTASTKGVIPQATGISHQDYEQACSEPNTVFVSTVSGDLVPALAPLEMFYWYNMDFLQSAYPDKVVDDFVYYSRVTIPGTAEVLAENLDEGKVVIVDRAEGEDFSPAVQELIEQGYLITALGGGDQERVLNQFIAEVGYGEVPIVRPAPSFFEQYILSKENELTTGLDSNGTGTEIAEVVEGEDAARLYSFYAPSFEDLAEDHPVNAGYDEAGFYDMLQDPSVTKIVHRVEGKISTLCLLVDDIQKCPWLDEQYYKGNYPEYYESSNILVFLGIVSDDAMRGNHYAGDLVKMLNETAEARGTDVLFTFECNERSTQWTPKIVQGAITSQPNARLTGLFSERDEELAEPTPVAQLRYYALTQQAA